MNKLQPVYKVLKGWQSSTQKCKRFNDLPANAKKYIRKHRKINRMSCLNDINIS